MRILLLAIFVLTFVSCKTTTWDGGIPKESSQLTSDVQRQAEFTRFSLTKINAGGFSLFPIVSEKRPTWASFEPVIEQVHPEARQRLNNLNWSSKFFYLAAGSSITFFVAPYLFPLSACALGGTWLWQYKQSQELTLEYNQALRHNIFAGKK